MNRWLVFVRERFSPLFYLPMIVIFLAAHYVLVDQMGLKVDPISVSSVLLVVGVAVFFLKLRFCDEIKDYEVDLEVHPNRPLPRGLVTRVDLKKGILFCIGTELVCFGLLGFGPLIGIAIAIAYCLLMYKEFFMSERIRPHLTTYALTHTAISVLLSLAVYSALSSYFVWQLNPAVYYFALSNWCLFTIFEFGRKTFSSQEEKTSIASYSKVFGRYGAVGLVITMAVLSIVLLALTPLVQIVLFWPLVTSALIVLSFLGLAYAIYNKPIFARVYRAASSAYLVFVYCGLLVSSLRTL